jgi:hypothetical protein
MDRFHLTTVMSKSTTSDSTARTRFRLKYIRLPSARADCDAAARSALESMSCNGHAPAKNVALQDRHKYNTDQFSYMNGLQGSFQNASDRFPA